MIKAIFFDADGTVLSHTGIPIRDSIWESFRLLKEKGILRILASGRDIYELPDLPINAVEFDAYLCLNGLTFYDANRNLLFMSQLNEEQKKEVLSVYHSNTLPMTLNTDKGMINNFINDYVIQAETEIHTPVPPVAPYTGQPIIQAVAFYPAEKDEEVQKLFPNAVITRWNPLGCDIVYNCNGKQDGIRKVLEILNLDISETMAFGDGENDIGMLEAVGIGVAMGNGIDEIKAVADYITDSVDEDGIYKALKHFEII